MTGIQAQFLSSIGSGYKWGWFENIKGHRRNHIGSIGRLRKSSATRAAPFRYTVTAINSPESQTAQNRVPYLVTETRGGDSGIGSDGIQVHMRTSHRAAKRTLKGGPALAVTCHGNQREHG